MQYQRNPIDELHKMFPEADREIIRSLFMTNDNNYEKTKIELSQLMNQSSGSRQGSYQNNSYSNRTTKPNPTRDYHNNYDGSDLAGQYQSSNSYGGYGEKNMEPNASNGKKKTSLVKKLKCGFAGLMQKGKKGILTESSSYNEIDDDINFPSEYIQNHMRQFLNEELQPEDFVLNFNMINSDIGNLEHPHSQPYDLSPSHSSYNCPSKHSVDYMQNSDLEGSEKLNDEESKARARSPRVRHKTIQKQYEPVVYNGVVYKYEDDPSEYKKARKRIQNRVSATRVRNKKKSYVEELEAEITTLREENAELKTKNNVLTTENTLLKQQIGFFEKLVMNTPKGTEWSQDPCACGPNEIRIDLESAKEESPKYFRTLPTGNIKKHTVFLGMLTIMLCMFGAFTETEETFISSLTNNTFGGHNRVSAYSINKLTGNEFDQQPRDILGNSLQTLDDSFTCFTVILRLIFMIVYVIYTIYVVSKVHRYFCANHA